MGFDPSAPDIHLGHTVVLRKMRHFQDAGHRVVFVIGDFTAMIGDPSGKKTTRPQLTREEIAANAATYTKQAFKILDAGQDRHRASTAAGSARSARPGSCAWPRESPSPASSSATTSRSAGTRSSRSRSTSCSIPLAQGYDSVALKADVELGGTDQLFNLLVGRDLMRAEGLEPQVVMTLPLLVGTDGVEKMSKSLGNAIGVLDRAGRHVRQDHVDPGRAAVELVRAPDRRRRRPRSRSGAAGSRRARRTRATPRPTLGRADRRRSFTAPRPRRAGRGGLSPRRSRGAKFPEDVETRDARRAEGGAPAAKTLVALGLGASMREARRKIAEGALKVYAEGAAEPSEVRDPEEPRLAAAGTRRCCAWDGASSAWPGRIGTGPTRGSAPSTVPGLRARPAAAADAPQLVGVRQQDEAVVRGDFVLQRLDARLEELDDAPALIADQVVVVVARAQALVPVAGLADPQAAHDPGVDHQLERAVDRGARDLLVLGAQAHEQLVGLHVLVPAEDLVKQGMSLGGELEAPPFQVLAEDLQLAAVPCDCDCVSVAIFSTTPGRCQARGKGRADAMWQGFTIALREGIEAFLIVALTLAYLKRTGRPELASAVYAAIAVSVLTCSAAGFLFSKAANQPLWEGILALVAAALVGSLLVYMKRVSKHLKSRHRGPHRVEGRRLARPSAPSGASSRSRCS